MKRTKNKNISLVYWFIPVGLFLFQLVLTLRSMNQIRFEELMESVTSVYWFAHRSVFYGAYTNVGWYAILLFIYKLFGFTLFTAKYYRLILHLVALFSLAALLRKYLGEKKALIPLIVIALSPTVLFFNTLQATFGTDLQYFPILLYWVDRFTFKKTLMEGAKQFFAGAFAMIALMSYPTFVYFLPVLFLFYFIKAKKVFGKNY